jgi:hypothetical protein
MVLVLLRFWWRDGVGVTVLGGDGVVLCCWAAMQLGDVVRRRWCHGFGVVLLRCWWRDGVGTMLLVP